MIYDMRMKIYGLIIIALLMGACSSDKPSKKCIYPAGDLFFSKEKASWSEVYIDKEYADTVLVFLGLAYSIMRFMLGLFDQGERLLNRGRHLRKRR